MRVDKSTRFSWSVLALLCGTFGFSSTNALETKVDSSTVSLVPESKGVKMVQVQKATYKNDFTGMADVIGFYENPANRCKASGVEDRNACFQIISIKLFSNTTYGTTQCPLGYSLAMTTDNRLGVEYSPGVVTYDSHLVYTPADVKDTSDDSKASAQNFYEGFNNYTKETNGKENFATTNDRSTQNKNADLPAHCARKFGPVNRWTIVPTVAGTNPIDKYIYLEKYEIMDKTINNNNASFYCRFTGQGAKYSRPAGYYYGVSRQGNCGTGINGVQFCGYSLPTPTTNPLTGPSTSICVKNATATEWIKQN